MTQSVSTIAFPRRSVGTRYLFRVRNSEFGTRSAKFKTSGFRSAFHTPHSALGSRPSIKIGDLFGVALNELSPGGYFAAHQQGEVPPGSRWDSAARQALFARYGFVCVLRRYEMTAYLQKELFPTHFMTASPISLSAFAPKYPDPANGRPVVVHCPTRKGTKGTSTALAAVETLKREEDFDFRLVHGVAGSERGASSVCMSQQYQQLPQKYRAFS